MSADAASDTVLEKLGGSSDKLEEVLDITAFEWRTKRAVYRSDAYKPGQRRAQA